MTTRTDEVVDSGLVDIGYHYPTTESFAGTPEITLMLNKAYFSPGDAFSLDIHTFSGQPNLIPVHLFVALETGGELWFYPEWRHFAPPDYPVSYKTVWIRNEIRSIIPEFVWPSIQTSSQGLHFMALCLNAEMSEIISNIDSVEWGFGY